MRPLLYALVLLTSPLALAADPKTRVEPKALDAEFPVGSEPDGTHKLAEKEVKVSASSQLCEGKGAKRVCHGPERLVDGKNDTAWCEGAAKDGVGESVTFEFSSPQEVVAVDVVPYYAKDMKRALGNARPATLLMQAGTQEFELSFADHPSLVSSANPDKPPSIEDGPCGDETCATQNERISWGERYRVTLPAPVKTQKVRLELLSTYEGDKHADTCMSAVTFHVR